MPDAPKPVEVLVSKEIEDIDLLRELVRRGRLRVESQTVDVPNGLEVWVRYSTEWLVDDKVVL